MCLLLLLINILDQYKTIHCKSTNKNIVWNKRYHTYQNSLKNLNQFIHKFTKTFNSVIIERRLRYNNLDNYTVTDSFVNLVEQILKVVMGQEINFWKGRIESLTEWSVSDSWIGVIIIHVSGVTNNILKLSKQEKNLFH